MYGLKYWKYWEFFCEDNIQSNNDDWSVYMKTETEEGKCMIESFIINYV